MYDEPDRLDIPTETQERAKKLAQEHWYYVKKVLETHNVNPDEIDRIGFHYQSAACHFYEHGREDLEKEMQDQLELAELMDIDESLDGDFPFDYSCASDSAVENFYAEDFDDDTVWELNFHQDNEE